MVGFLHRTAAVDDHTVIALMVLQVIVVLVTVGQVNVPFLRLQFLLGSIFIDHISTVVSRGGRTVYYMYRSQLLAVCRVQVSNRTSIAERNHLWQR